MDVEIEGMNIKNTSVSNPTNHVIKKAISGAYIHDLRRFLFNEKFYWKKWRIEHLKKAKGNTYPTHGSSIKKTFHSTK